MSYSFLMSAISSVPISASTEAVPPASILLSASEKQLFFLWNNFLNWNITVTAQLTTILNYKKTKKNPKS